MSTELTSSKKRPRSFLRYGLRSLIVAMIVIAFVINAWLVPARAQRRAVEQLRAAGLEQVEFDELPSWSKWLPQWIVNLEEGHLFRKVTRLTISDLKPLDDADRASNALSSQTYGAPLDEADRALEVAAKLPYLKSLRCEYCNFSAQRLAEVAASTQIEWLAIHGCELYGPNAEGNAPRLKLLSIDRLDRFDRIADWVARSPNLESIEIEESFLETDGLEALAAHEKLKSFRIDGGFHPGSVDGNSVLLSKIQSWPNLKKLDLDVPDNWLSDRFFEVIGNSKSIQKLSLPVDGITPNGWRHLQKLPELNQLNLYGQMKSEKMIDGLFNLRSVSLIEFKHYDNNFQLSLLKRFAELPNLKWVSGGGGKVQYDVEPYNLSELPNRIVFHEFNEHPEWVFKEDSVFPWGNPWANFVTANCVLSKDLIDGIKAKSPIKSLSLNRVSFDETSAELIADIPTLQKISIVKCSSSEAAICTLLKSRSLFEVSIVDTDVGDLTAEALAAMPELQSLNLQFTEITDVGFASLNSSSSVQGLNVNGSLITNEGFSQLAKLKSLTSLDVTISNVTEVNDEEWMHHPSLLSFRVNGTRHPKEEFGQNQGVSQAVRFRKELDQEELLDFSASYHPLTSEEVTRLAQHQELTVLFLARSNLRDSDLNNILPKAKLTALNISSNPITDAGIVKLSSCLDLTELTLSGHAITDQCLTTLCQLKAMQHLTMEETGLSEKGLTTLVDSLHELKYLELDGDWITPRSLRSIAKLPKLEELELTSKSIAASDMAILNESKSLTRVRLNKEVFELGKLRQRDINKVMSNVELHGPIWTDEEVEWLRNEKHICSISVRFSSLGERGFECISSLPDLAELSVFGQEITPGALEHLAHTKALRHLNLSQTKLTQDHWKALSQLTQLKSLSLRQIDVADDDMRFLPPSLESLEIVSKTLTDKFWDYVAERKQLSNVSVYWQPFSIETIYRVQRQRKNGIDVQWIEKYDGY